MKTLTLHKTDAPEFIEFVNENRTELIIADSKRGAFGGACHKKAVNQRLLGKAENHVAYKIKYNCRHTEPTPALENRSAAEPYKHNNNRHHYSACKQTLEIFRNDLTAAKAHARNGAFFNKPAKNDCGNQ